jgi:tetratricopeptide (TPR) repeat protein
MRVKIEIFLALVILISGSTSFAQHKNIKARIRSEIKIADKLFEEKAYQEAAFSYKNIIRKDSANSKAYFKLAESYRLLNNSTEAEYFYKRGLHLDAKAPSIYKYHYAEILLTNGKKEESSYWFDLYYNEEKLDKVSINKKEGLSNYDDYYNDSLSYSIKEISINSKNSDFSPVLYDKGIVFLSSRDHAKLLKYYNGSDNASFLNLYYSEIDRDTIYKEPIKFGSFGNTLHEGPVTFWSKGRKAVFSMSSKGSDKSGVRLALYYAEKSTGSDKWSNITPLPFNSKSHSNSHPYYDEKTNTLYFVSNMPDGRGGTDIYKVNYNKGKWGNPENLGKEINTKGNEMFPFFSHDSCLYFSSNGHSGMGGIDLFKVDYKKQNLKVVNLGYPINSPKDDFTLVMDRTGSKGFISSNRKNGGTDDDIYEVKFHTVRVKGIVVDKLKAAPQKEALVTIKDSKTGEIIETLNTNAKGEFSTSIKPGKVYRIEVVKDNYKFNKTDIIAFSEKNIKIKIILEKSNKSFVKGKVLVNMNILQDAKVRIIDLHADSVETLYTDVEGEFQCEINTDTINIFYIEKGEFKGIYKLEASKKKRRGSGVSYITLHLGDIFIKEVSGIYKDTSGVPLIAQELILRNELTGQDEIVVTDQEGRFAKNLWVYGKYKFYRMENNEKQLLVTFIPDQTPFLEISK